MDIFQRIKLRPSQLRTVAERRLDDARALRDTGENARANGAIYLAGFVVECLLKAKLLQRYPWLQSAGTHTGKTAKDLRLWSLCYRSHDLDEILEKLPDILITLSKLEHGQGSRLIQSLKTICAEWSIFARYSPYNADIDDARHFLAQIEELKEWLK
ncbi:MAG TPA: hypothetical protein VHQ47_00595 [Phycisphaerae bacterium]|jgi:hypothetical protein|nr:hypothetical protein [Phycisphaerae bacterium]